MFSLPRRLFFRRSLRPLALPPLHPDQLFLVEIREGLPKNALLQVPPGQSLCFFQGAARSRVFPSGAQRFSDDTLDPDAPLTLVMLQHEVHLHRRWQTLYPTEQTDSITAENRAIAGSYRLTLENDEHFCDCLLALPAPFGLTSLDDLIADRVLDVLRQQSVPIDDIRGHSARLGSFLHEAITPVLRTAGLDLVELKIHPGETGVGTSRQTMPPDFGKYDRETAKTVKRADDPQTISAARETHPSDHDPAAQKNGARAASPQTPRLYYRVHGGRQIGPMGLFELQEQIDQGVIGPRDLLWKQGMNAWRRASEFDELRWADN